MILLAKNLKDCHNEAHDGHGIYINDDIQKELMNIIINRSINENLQEQYNNIKNNIIQPWIKNYITLLSNQI